MKSTLENVAAFLAVAIWADGVYADGEKKILGEIAQALETDESELKTAVDTAVASLEKKNDDEITEYVTDHASQIEEEDVLPLMECAIEIVLADNVITKDEVNTLFDLVDATGIVEHSDVLLMVADLVKYEPDIDIQF